MCYNPQNFFKNEEKLPKSAKNVGKAQNILYCLKTV